MTKSMRGLSAAFLALAFIACSDSLGLDESGDRGLQLSLVTAAVSAEERAALGSAFDRVDEYHVTIVDAATAELLADTVISITTGQTTHTLDVDLPEEAVGRTVTITLVASANGMELYRSVSTVTLEGGQTQLPVELEIRYSGPGVRGTIVDANGVGMAGVVVQLQPVEEAAILALTEDDGTYLFVDVQPDDYLVVPVVPPSVSYVCPGRRDVTVSTADDVIIVDFSTSTDPCGLDVLVLSGGDFDDTDAVAIMLSQSLGLPVSPFFHVNELPGVDFLKEFDVVLLFMNGLFDESPTLGAEVAEYVNSGGNVVIASFYWQGRSDSGLGSTGWGVFESMDPFSSAGGARYVTSALDPLSVVQHPLTDGLTTLDATSYWGGATEQLGTNVVAQWEDGSPLIGYRTLPGGQRIVGVTLFPAAGAVATGDVQQLWANAVTWAGEAGGPR